MWYEDNLKVCQEALYLIRQDVGVPANVSAANADTSIEWRKCAVAFDNARKELLAEHDWLFAVKLSSETCAATSGGEAMMGGKKFSLPTDCLRVVSVSDADGKPLAWRRAGNSVYLNDAAGASVAYLADIEDTSLWSREARNALVYLLARELAVPLAGREGDLKNWHELYSDKLHAARVADLQAAGTGDEIEREVLSLVVGDFSQDAAKLPRSLRAYTDRIALVRDGTRRTILSAHAWNFAKTSLRLESRLDHHLPAPYVHTAILPANCLHLNTVRGFDGRPVEWRVENRRILACEPFAGIAYTRDREDMSNWTDAFRRAYVLRLASDVVRVLGGAQGDLQILEQKYEKAIAEAKTIDARESHTPQDAWGESHHVNAMRGIRPGAPHQPRWAFHGMR